MAIKDRNMETRNINQYDQLMYRKLENFHVEIIHVVNIHVNLFSWVCGTHENILTWTYFNTNI